jgi:LPXTG-site transpeptidase (sortase) family protein
MPTFKNTSNKKDILKVLGILLILGGFLLLYLIYFPVLKEEISYRFVSVKNSSQEKEEIIPVDEDFALVIPKININAKVFPKVDASNPKEYLPLLAKGVAQAKGSANPGEEGNVFIFAHSTDTSLNASRYNAVFYLLNKMEKDDEVIVYYQQEKYLYQVLEKKIIRPEELNDYLKTLKGKTLTLQTCYPPGTTINRLLVIAKETEE